MSDLHDPRPRFASASGPSWWHEAPSIKPAPTPAGDRLSALLERSLQFWVVLREHDSGDFEAIVPSLGEFAVIARSRDGALSGLRRLLATFFADQTMRTTYYRPHTSPRYDPAYDGMECIEIVVAIDASTAH